MVDLTSWLPLLVSAVSAVAGYGFLSYSYYRQSGIAYLLAQMAIIVVVLGLIAQVLVFEWSNMSYMWAHRELWFGFLIGGIVCLVVAGILWLLDARFTFPAAAFYGFVLMWVGIVMLALSSIAYSITQLQYRLGVGSILLACVIGSILSFALAAGANWIASHDWGIGAELCKWLRLVLLALGVIFLFVGGMIWEYPALISFFWGGR